MKVATEGNWKDFQVDGLAAFALYILFRAADSALDASKHALAVFFVSHHSLARRSCTDWLADCFRVVQCHCPTCKDWNVYNMLVDILKMSYQKQVGQIISVS